MSVCLWPGVRTRIIRHISLKFDIENLLLELSGSFHFCSHWSKKPSLHATINYFFYLSRLTFSRLTTYIYIYIYIYICRIAPLTSKCSILYIYSTNIRTEYFKHAAHSPFFPLQNAIYFIMLPFLVPVLFTF